MGPVIASHLDQRSAARRAINRYAGISHQVSLRATRIFEEHNEVGFLVHSLGGLVMQRLLLTHRELVPKVRFIYFSRHRKREPRSLR